MRNPVRSGLGVYLGTLVLLLVIAGTIAAATGFSLSTFGTVLRDGSILLGLFWIVVGFLLGSSVNAYVGPGGYSRAPPMIWPASALPERSPNVLENLKVKLSDPQSLSIFFVILGIVGVLLGFVAYASAVFGVLAAATLTIGVAVLLLVTTPRSRANVRG